MAMKRLLRCGALAVSVAMLVSGFGGVALGAAAARGSSGTVPRIPLLDWTPKRTGAEAASLRMLAGASTSLQTFTTKVHDGTSTFSYTMVGKNPFVHQATPKTTIKTTLIPVIVKFSNGDKWDPTAINSCDSKSAVTRTQKSPVFVAQPWKFGPTSVGTGQYLDAFQRAEFYRQTRPAGINPGYHVALTLATHAPLVLTVPNAKRAEVGAGCGNFKLARVEINYLDAQLQHYIKTTLGSAATNTFPLFLVANVTEYDTTPGGFYIGGYHNAMVNAGKFQTYALSMYDTSGDFTWSADTAILTHEVGEWMNDPNTVNPTKRWGHTGQVSGCQNNLEVGDPLTGTFITDTLNGKTYHLQELAFFSWFYHSKPSLGVNGWFSSHGTFKTSAKTCT